MLEINSHLQHEAVAVAALPGSKRSASPALSDLNHTAACEAVFSLPRLKISDLRQSFKNWPRVSAGLRLGCPALTPVSYCPSDSVSQPTRSNSQVPGSQQALKTSVPPSLAPRDGLHVRRPPKAHV